MTIKHNIYLSLLSILATLLIFEMTQLDLSFQALLYDENTSQWFWDKSEPISRFLLYDGIKASIILLEIGLFLMLLSGDRIDWVRSHRSAIRISCVSLLIVPSMVGFLKMTTNVACPSRLAEFGGVLPYVKLFEFYPKGFEGLAHLKCFPAGHASAGFSLFSLMFFFTSSANRYALLGIIFALAWMMGLYKMAIGDHFFSHTLISMEIACLLIAVITLFDRLFFDKKTHNVLN